MYYNKVTLIGYVGSDPEVHYYRPGACRVLLMLGTMERGYTRRDGSQVPERTDWHRVIAFGETAQFIEKWVKKGQYLLIEGQLHYRNKFTACEGRTLRIAEIWADRVQYLDTRPPTCMQKTAHDGTPSLSDSKSFPS